MRWNSWSGEWNWPVERRLLWPALSGGTGPGPEYTPGWAVPPHPENTHNTHTHTLLDINFIKQTVPNHMNVHKLNA